MSDTPLMHDVNTINSVLELKYWNGESGFRSIAIEKKILWVSKANDLETHAIKNIRLL
jgi:hypothetical protein